MAKTHWSGVAYQITKINLYKDGKHGKAWGIVHKDEPSSCERLNRSGFYSVSIESFCLGQGFKPPSFQRENQAAQKGESPPTEQDH
ncbi:28S ribosomal protein S34 [Artemisia annua]|uniref:28S ribosomal protein S34 n=1 Tax=Artemisia annua TaxID=35608 RepID=A0A2U1Q700_ARTAN|nr:28S ribosomal protein S34 [Artemisia annua]